MSMTIRAATPADVPATTSIYNDAVLNSTATFDTAPKTVAQQHEWLEKHTPRFPVLVAEVDGAVVAWASLGHWSDRQAYADTAEGSLYVQRDYRRRGIGRKLLKAVLVDGKRAGLHTGIGRIAEGNEASLKLVQSLGFTRSGTMREVGFKFGKRLDVHMVQVMLDSLPSAV